MPTTWNPSDKNAGIGLSGGNLVATSSAGSGSVNQAIRATTAMSPTIKQYFEVTVSAGANQYFSAGLLNGSASLAANIGATNGGALVIKLSSSGSTLFRNGSAYFLTGPLPAVGNVIRIAVDRAANKAWWAVNAIIWPGGTTIWMGSGTINDDPATGTGGMDLTTVTGTIYPAFSSAWTGDAATINPGPFGFAYAIPSGFIALDGVPASVQARAMILA